MRKEGIDDIIQALAATVQLPQPLPQRMATILVVDDEQATRTLIAQILGHEGHRVELADGAVQARACLSRVRPALVLLDVWMPDGDGITLLKAWRADAQLTMPVIMLSGYGTIAMAVEATKVGAIAFLEKPISRKKLLQAVNQGLGEEEALKPSLSADEMNAPPPATINPGAGLPSATRGPLWPPNALLLGPTPEQTFSLAQPLREARADFERRYFEFHLARQEGSMTRVAEKAGLERSHLYRKLKALGIDLAFRRPRLEELIDRGQKIPRCP